MEYVKICNCFIAGTKVQTDEGKKNIEDIEIGDKVLSKDEKTGKVSYKEVKATFNHEIDEIYKISVGGKAIESTFNHPFYVKDKGWIFVKDLKVGDLLVQSNGNTLKIDDIELLHKHLKVYNMTVYEFHTYFVSDLGIWVHNTDPCNIYNSIKIAPKYPEGFTAVQNGTVSNTVKNKELLDKLREFEPGEWKKVYKDGDDANGRRVSIHYFQSKSGKVFDVDVKSKWSNLSSQ